jgi:hypothetical protein
VNCDSLRTMEPLDWVSHSTRMLTPGRFVVYRSVPGRAQGLCKSEALSSLRGGASSFSVGVRDLSDPAA